MRPLSNKRLELTPPFIVEFGLRTVQQGGAAQPHLVRLRIPPQTNSVVNTPRGRLRITVSIGRGGSVSNLGRYPNEGPVACGARCSW